MKAEIDDLDATGQSPTHDANELPPGNSSVEIAARRGLGPLSPLGAQVWHGQSQPCVSCGQLVRRDATACPDCGEDLSADKIELMRAHAGPWYVHEHVRPFPGVKLDRLVRQIRRGVLTATTIVRGPTTDHQWRFAAETPGLSQYLGVCWNCQASVSAQDHACVGCGASLSTVSAHVVPPAPGGNTPGGNNVQLAALRRAVGVVSPRPALEPEAPRFGKIRVGWVVAAIVVVLIAGLFAVVQMRNAGLRQASSESSATTSSL